MDEFVKAADASEIPLGKMKIVKIGSMEIMIANVDGAFYALPNKCTHQGGPLGKGKLVGPIVQCPFHGSKFDVRTGAVVGPPATIPEKSIEVKLDGQSVWVRSPSPG